MSKDYVLDVPPAAADPNGCSQHDALGIAIPYHTVSSPISQPKVDRRTRKSPRAAVAVRACHYTAGQTTALSPLFGFGTPLIRRRKTLCKSSTERIKLNMFHSTYELSRCQRSSSFLDSETRPGVCDPSHPTLSREESLRCICPM